MTKCKHGVPDESMCSYCNPPPPLKRVDPELQELHARYMEREKFLSNEDVLWIEDDVATVYLQVVLGNAQNRTKLVYQTALELGRTKKAFEWICTQLTEPEKDWHRGIVVLRFMLENDLFRSDPSKMTFVLLKNIQTGETCHRPNVQGVNHAFFYDGPFEILGYADTVREAKLKLGDSNSLQ